MKQMFLPDIKHNANKKKSVSKTFIEFNKLQNMRLSVRSGKQMKQKRKERDERKML